LPLSANSNWQAEGVGRREEFASRRPRVSASPRLPPLTSEL